ncbi:MAG: PDDEXK nuclease domain-containing protein [Defluviitaleaceae bacterium]|nr:PDDEXK nuclease domain-containing protein [Defluviitaleaceae bacterium]
MAKKDNISKADEKTKMQLISSDSIFDFFENVVGIIEQARRHVGRTADLTMCVTYFEVGRMIVEEEQGGKARAKYGRRLLAELSAFLNNRVGKGFSESTLKNARKFYKTYSPSIQHIVSTELEADGKNQIRQTLFAELYPFTLGWSHYLILMRIENQDERQFYEIEATKQQWTFRQLQRQYGSSLYERLALSRDKDEFMRLAQEGQRMEKPPHMLKNPLVLEFLDLEEDSSYSETDLESAIISKLSNFLLELGKGFLFEARQKRFTFDEDHFIVDLVFYNRLLDCYVLLDLKTSKLKHQDLGQLQMYVNYFDRYVKTEKENPTIGILLCKKKNDSVVELTLPDNSNIYASEYSLYLPDKTLLQSKLAEWIEEFEEIYGGTENESDA